MPARDKRKVFLDFLVERCIPILDIVYSREYLHAFQTASTDIMNAQQYTLTSTALHRIAFVNFPPTFRPVTMLSLSVCSSTFLLKT